MTFIADFRAYHWAKYGGMAYPIEQQAVDATVTWRELEDRYEQSDIRCEGSHTHHNPACTVQATHIANGCNKREVPICQSLYRAKRAYMLRGGICVACENPARDCWSYRPI